MFSWYQKSQICYAYLSDVNHSPWINKNSDYFAKSEWFTRGWTLQELIAPRWVDFLDHGWNEIGTKSSLAKQIETITGISHLFGYEDASVAQRMSWAAKRETTRAEDHAYCVSLDPAFQKRPTNLDVIM